MTSLTRSAALILVLVAGCGSPASSGDDGGPSTDDAGPDDDVGPRDHDAAQPGDGGPLRDAATSGECRAFFCDDFEYDVSRSATDGELAFLAAGWDAVKAENTGRASGAGWLYTRTDATLGSRVLVLESQPVWVEDIAAEQTDYYLQHGVEGGPPYFPPNAWIQFSTYATPESRFADRDKTIYPCRTTYGCPAGQWSWMFLWGSRGFEEEHAAPGARLLALFTETADFRAAAEYPTNRAKLFQNAARVSMLAGVWYDVRLHIDISGEQGVYQAWIRERGVPEWTQVADWRGGVTPDFDWPIPPEQRTGFAQVRVPTTVNGPDDSTTYLDDYVVGRSIDELP